MSLAAHPAGYSFWQSLWRTYKQVKNPIGSMEESMERFNGTYSVNFGRKRLIATQDPGFIEHVLKSNHRNYHKSKIMTEQLGRFIGRGLLTSNGDYWLKQRRLIQPGFHHEKIFALFQIIQDTAHRFLDAFPSGKQVDVYPLMNTVAFEIVINTLFNVEIESATRRQLSRFISETQDFVIRDIRQPYKSWWFEISGEVKKNLVKAQAARESLRKLIHDRKASAKKHNDLLDMLLDARYEDDGAPMREEQVIDEILILLIAGHETTANALSFALYSLAENPEVQQRARAETHGLTLEQIVRNETINAIINETMRLYPPAWISDRVALQDDQYQDLLIPKDTILILFYYGLHRDSKYWQAPDKFLPERFKLLSHNKDKPKAFYPFGGGPRMCIGNNFAMAEMAIFLQGAIQRFEFKTTGIVPSLKPLVTLRPVDVVLEIEGLKAANH